MDKDLGLFEMINAGDFATVTNQPAQAQASASDASSQQQQPQTVGGQGAAAQQTFTFEELMADAGEGSASQANPAAAATSNGQAPNDMFNFASNAPAAGGLQLNVATPSGGGGVADNNVTNDLFDVFSTNAPQGGGTDAGKAADPLANIFAAGD